MKKFVVLSIIIVLVIAAVLALIQIREPNDVSAKAIEEVMPASKASDLQETEPTRVFESNEPVNNGVSVESEQEDVETNVIDGQDIDLEELQKENQEAPKDSETTVDEDMDMVYLPEERNITDYDGDGVLDWVKVEADGLRYVYINKGTNNNPIFEEGILIE